MLKRALTRSSPVVLGTILSQLIAVMSLPALSRIYTPESFALLAIVTASSTLGSIVLTMRLEIVLLKCVSNYKRNLVMSAIVMSMATYAALLLVVLSLSILFFSFEMPNVYTFSILGAYSVAVFNVFQSYSISQGDTKKLGQALILRSVLFCLLSISLSLLGIQNGLLFSFSLSYILAVALWLHSILRSFKFSKIKRVYVFFKRNKKTVLFFTPHSLFGATILHAPTYILTIFYSSQIVGLYSMANRLVSMPMSVITGVLNKVTLNEFAKSEKQQEKKKYFKLAIIIILSLYFLFTCMLYVWGESLITILLGTNWSGVLGFFLALIPWIAARTVAGIFAFAPILKGRQGTALLFELAYGGLCIIALYVSSAVHSAAEDTIMIFSFTGASIVALQLCWYYKIMFGKALG